MIEESFQFRLIWVLLNISLKGYPLNIKMKTKKKITKSLKVVLYYLKVQKKSATS